MPRMKILNSIEQEAFELPPVLNSAERKRVFHRTIVAINRFSAGGAMRLGSRSSFAHFTKSLEEDRPSKTAAITRLPLALISRARVQAQFSSVLAPHDPVPRAMDHHFSDCLPAEKFPTFASGQQDRGPVTLLSFHRQFLRWTNQGMC